MADRSTVAEQSPLLSFTRSNRLYYSAIPSDLSSQCNPSHQAFLSFLTTIQESDIDIIPIQWQPALETVGEGATAEIRQLYIDLQTSFVFKRFRWSDADESSNYQALICEVSILGHPSIRSHPNIVRLEGVCWDTSLTDEGVWPVLVFEKALHGDLRRFLNTDAGKSLTWKDRINICADIAAAIVFMHSCHIIHGDIKPDNVLVFKNEGGGYVAKMTDFGYSTLNVTDGLIFMPRSKPWDAPEWHHRGFRISDAARMDIFRSEFFTGIGSAGIGSALAFAQSHTKGTSRIREKSQGNLHHFFQLTLALNPQERSLDFEQLISCLAPTRHPTKMSSSASKIDHRTLKNDLPLFPSIYRLYQADFRLRSHIFHCLQNKTSDPESKAFDKTASGRAALQLAFCYKVGFGTRRNDGASSNVLNSNATKVEELGRHIDSLLRTLAEFQEGKFGDLFSSGRLAVINFAADYRFYHQWERTADHYRKEIKDTESVFGKLHMIPLFLQGVLSGIYANQGQLQQAVLLDKQVMETASRALGTDNPNTLASITNLAVTLKDQGNFREAERLSEFVMQKCLNLLGLDNLRSIQSIHLMAHILTQQGRWDEAEKLENHAFNAYGNTVGRDHPETLDSLSNLAQIKVGQGNWEEAGKLHFSVLETRKRVLGEDHYATMASKSCVANYFEDLQQWKDAETLRVEVLNERVRSFGDEHVTVLASMSDIASCYAGQERWQEAEQLQVKAMTLSQKIRGNKHPNTLGYTADLASLYISQEKWTEGIRLHHRVRNLMCKSIGKEHPRTLTSLGNLAYAYIQMKRWKQAERWASHVLRMRKRVLGTQHPHTIDSITQLVTIFSAQERWAKAETKYHMLVNSKKEALGPDDPSTLISMANLAQGNIRVLGQDHPQTLHSMAAMALLLMHLEQWNKAEELQVRVLKSNEDVFGETHSNTILSVENLGDLYTASGRPRQADEYYERARRLRDQCATAEDDEAMKDVPEE